VAIAEMTLGLSSDHDGSTYFQISRRYRLEGKTVEAQQAVNHAKALIAQRRDRAVNCTPRDFWNVQLTNPALRGAFIIYELSAFTHAISQLLPACLPHFFCLRVCGVRELCRSVALSHKALPASV
jgi:hypothetical protein